MFNIRLKFSIADREVRLNHFADALVREVARVIKSELEPTLAKARRFPPPESIPPSLPATERIPQPLLVSAREAARLLGIKESTVRSYFTDKRLPRVKVGRRTFVRRDVIEAIAGQGLAKPARGVSD